MNSQSFSFKIILKIWIGALFMNTLFGTAVLTDLYTYADAVGVIALLGFLYAAVFTLPFIILLFVSLRLFVRMDLRGKKLFGVFFFTGLLLTMISFTAFFMINGTLGFPVWALLIVALSSVAVAMLLEYKPVIELKKEDEEFNSFLE